MVTLGDCAENIKRRADRLAGHDVVVTTRGGVTHGTVMERGLETFNLKTGPAGNLVIAYGIVLSINPIIDPLLMFEALWAAEACERSNANIGGLNDSELYQLGAWAVYLHNESLGIKHEFPEEEDVDPDDPLQPQRPPTPEIGRALVKRVLAVPEDEW